MLDTMAMLLAKHDVLIYMSLNNILKLLGILIKIILLYKIYIALKLRKRG